MKRRTSPELAGDDGKRPYPGFTNTWSLKDATKDLRPKQGQMVNGNNGTPADISNNTKAKAKSKAKAGSGSVSTSLNNITTQPAAPKTLRACQNCRKLKIKCKGTYGENCERCSANNLECVYEIKVATNATTLPDSQWMSTVEKRLDGFGQALNMIVGLLQQNNNAGTLPGRNSPPGVPGLSQLNNGAIGASKSPPSLEYQSHINDGMGSDRYRPHPDSGSLSQQHSHHQQAPPMQNPNITRVPELLSLAGTPPTAQLSPMSDFGQGSMDGFSKFLSQNTDIDFQQMLDDLDKFDRNQLDNLGNSEQVTASASTSSSGSTKRPDTGLNSKHAKFHSPSNEVHSHPSVSSSHNNHAATNSNVNTNSPTTSDNKKSPEDDVSPESSLLNIFNSRSSLELEQDILKNGTNRSPSKAHSNSNTVDFRQSGVISFGQASELFSFFHEKISPHLFGFSTSHLELPNVWARSPILVAAICTVAAVHHKTLNYLFKPLKEELDMLSKQVLFSNITSELEAIDTIVALCVAGFWLPDSSMLTAMALRIARNFSLNLPNRGSDGINIEDRLRLWYLIYILDGHQSLAYNQTPLIEFNDSAVNVSRKLLLQKNGGTDKPAELLQCISNQSNQSPLSQPNDKDKQVSEHQRPPVDKNTLLSDITLISQVEFNQAIKCVFQERAWDLLSPSSLGIPWKTNMELDKWMVAWACLLTPSETNQNPWSSKSTLIHYNFAKMHINSRKIRELQSEGSVNDHGGSNSNKSSPSGGHVSVGNDKAEGLDKNCDSIALSAAQSVIRLSTTDSDVLNALQYVPIHMHIMLYYAGILVLNSVSPYASPRSVRDSFELVKQLRSALFSSSPRSDTVIKEIDNRLKEEIRVKSAEVADILVLKQEDGESSHENKRHIAAWPGSMSGHLDT